MKTILAFGDSLTWGFVPGTRERYPRDVRWPKVLEAGFDGRVEVLENGLNARTTVHENPFRDYRAGTSVLPVLLEVHAPLDLVILALGSNDFHSNYGMSPLNVARGMRRLVQTVKTYQTEPGMPVPEVLVIAPPRIVKTDDPYYGNIFGNTHEIFDQLAPLYEQLAREEAAHFFNAATVASGTPIDGIHLSADDTVALGKALIDPVRTILSL
ncbi:MAG: SGNH/GDSL hydrolase family protein [Pseudomonadota bacterium]